VAIGAQAFLLIVDTSTSNYIGLVSRVSLSGKSKGQPSERRGTMGRTNDESKNDWKQRRQECNRMTREDTKFGNVSYEDLRKANYFAEEKKKKAGFLERVRLMNEKTSILLEKKHTSMETLRSRHLSFFAPATTRSYAKIVLCTLCMISSHLCVRFAAYRWVRRSHLLYPFIEDSEVGGTATTTWHQFETCGCNSRPMLIALHVFCC
jgi:hypothetical protein